jgi:hypothetical protein
VQKIRVGQNRETGVAQNHRRRADEKNRAALEISRLAGNSWKLMFGYHLKSPHKKDAVEV